MICNGDCCDKIGEFGQAVAALVDDGNCSSLSITACSIGNVGAAALAKACCREGLEELCLVACAIGNAGAAALMVALGEGIKRTTLLASRIWDMLRNVTRKSYVSPERMAVNWKSSLAQKQLITRLVHVYNHISDTKTADHLFRSL